MATNVLIVEDDDAVAQALRDVLETEGYTVWRAGTGAEADAIQRERHPNLILLDIMLPDVNGLVYCSDLRRRTNTPVILISGTQRQTVRVTLARQPHRCRLKVPPPVVSQMPRPFHRNFP